MFSIIKLRKKQSALEPLIATILLIVVSVILVTIVLTWGKEFSTSSLNKTNNFAELKASDVTHFIYPKSAVDGVVQFTYSPPAQISNDINITHYRVVNIPEMTEPIALSEPKILSPSLNILELPCLYEYSTTTPDLFIQLITADNTYIDIKTKDAGMVCSSGGTGTEIDPKIICTAEDLNDIRDGWEVTFNYKLGKDIDLQCFSRIDANGWVPIGDEDTYFEGLFDGQNHTIKNLYINRPATNDVGLFGFMDNAEIRNLRVIDINITGNYYVGGLIGRNNNSNLINNYSSGFVSGGGDVGGLFGIAVLSGIDYDNSNVIDSCFSSGTVIGTSYEIGGLGGYLGWGTLSNSYSTANVIGNTVVGGLIGWFREEGEGIMNNCYAVGSVSGNSQFGGLIGANSHPGGINNLYYDINTSGQSDTGKGVPKTTSEMKTQSTFTDWDFSTVWAIDSTKNDGYPYLINNPPR